MTADYHIDDLSDVYSPALLFFKDLIRQNIAQALQLAGRPDRLRPHVKTHKTREIVRLELDAGITKQKCATLAEAEMLTQVGVPDVLLAYQMVGPNCGRLARLVKNYPACRFSVLVDHPTAAQALSVAMTAAGVFVDVLLDLDVGQHRTGIAPGSAAQALYESLQSLPGLRPTGLHAYDGHNHVECFPDRQAMALRGLEPVLALRSALQAMGLQVPRLVLGGTPTFPVYAQLDLPGLECTPGTCVLYDHGYRSRFPDLSFFRPAALLLTRVVSLPTPTRLTLDLGYKAVASDPPAGQRCVLLGVPDYQIVGQNEEHLMVETAAAQQFGPGNEVLAIPTHICPTCALHHSAYVIENGRVAETWAIAARDRVLTI
jgi:D-serine deaminase-like pyridoxal phosphate-dependent protein